MRYCLSFFTALGLVAFLACGSGEEINLTQAIPCGEDNPCPGGYSCRVNKCVELGSLREDETCTLTDQCQEGLICRDYTCQPGCLDIWYLDDCQPGSWCKPVPGETVPTRDGELPAGECVPSECNPAVSDFCTGGPACVSIATDIGACLPYCEYSFDSDGYYDGCADDGGIDYACQPLGLTSVPVCFPAGVSGAPTVGLPGCDAVRNPCAGGNICFNVVCRQLCSEAQLDPCGTGEVCAAVGQRADLAFCRAD